MGCCATEPTQTACNSGGSSCGGGYADECLEDLTVTSEELEGADKHKAISNTLKNEEVKKLRSKLIEEGYTPAFNYAVAVNVVIQETGDDPYSYQATSVVLPFRSQAEGSNGVIISISIVEKTRTFATMMNVIDVDDNDVIDDNDEIDIEVFTVDEQGHIVTGAGSDCMDYCLPIFGAIMYTVCCIICPGTCIWNWWCLPFCGALAALIAYVFCSDYFCDDPLTWCGIDCVVLCGAVCSQFGVLEGLVCGAGCGAGCAAVKDGYCD